MKERRFLASIVALLAVGLVGLAGCTEPEDQSEGDDCGPGKVSIGGQCVRSNPDPDGTVTDGGGEDAAETDGTDYDESGCGEEGCAEGEFCFQGRCRQGSSCEPGTHFGCYDDQTLRVCPSKGLGFQLEQCPQEKPNCISFRKEGCEEQDPECFEYRCTEKVCEPGAKYCDGNTVKKCNENGTEESTVEMCRGGCSQGECVSACEGNAKSYIGCGFYALDLDNWSRNCSSDSDCSLLGRDLGPCNDGACAGDNANAQPFGVVVSNTTSRSLDLNVLNGSGDTVKSQPIGGGELQRIQLPRNDTENTEISRKHYRIEANGPVTAYQFQPLNESGVKSNDASLLLPASALGSDYRIMGWKAAEGLSPDNPVDAKPFITIVAVESTPVKPNTDVIVEPTTKIKSGGDVPSIPAGGSHEFTLERGEVLQLAAPQEALNDLTGSVVKTRGNRIAVFSAVEASRVPADTDYFEHLEQQLFPTSTWRSKYVVPKHASRGSESDVVRVLADLDDTKVLTKPEIEGVHGTTLDAGEVLEFKTDRSIFIEGVDAKPCRFEGEDCDPESVEPEPKRISVAQFMVGSDSPGVTRTCDDSGGPFTPASTLGDPAFLLNVPTTQYRENYVVNTPDGYTEDYLGIVYPAGATVTLDGNVISSSSPENVPDTKWQVINKQVEPGAHRVSADQPVGVTSYGYECDVSYAYPGGLSLDQGARGGK